MGQQYVHFPTSTLDTHAQWHFSMGLAMFHNFQYEFARQHFQFAQVLDANFTMAFAMEACTYYLPVWMYLFREPAQLVLQRMPPCNNCTAREQDYVNAIRDLFLVSPDAYVQQLQTIVKRNDDDVEAKLVLIQALFGRTLPENRGYRTRDPIAAQQQQSLLQAAKAVVPNHPGVLHYGIHMFDDPDMAFLFVNEGSKYPRVAPNSNHAQHMPTHLYLRMGMHGKALLGNMQSVDASITLGTIYNQTTDESIDFHSYEYMHYEYLMLGKIQLAQASLEFTRAKIPTQWYLTASYALMYARQAIETDTYPECTSAPDPFVFDESQKGDLLFFNQAYAGLLFVCGVAASKTNDSDIVGSVLYNLDNLMKRFATVMPIFAESVQSVYHQVLAIQYQLSGDLKNSLIHAKSASDLEMKNDPPAYGPPLEPVKPSTELYAQVLLQSGDIAEALKMFNHVQYNHPNRTTTVLGIATCHEKLGMTQSALQYYKILAQQLENCDLDLAIMRTAQAKIKTLEITQNNESLIYVAVLAGALLLLLMTSICLSYLCLKVFCRPKPEESEEDEALILKK